MTEPWARKAVQDGHSTTWAASVHNALPVEELLEICIDAGVDDFGMSDDDDDDDDSRDGEEEEDVLLLHSSPADMAAIQKMLKEEKGLDSTAETIFKPSTYVTIDDPDTIESMEAMLEAFEEHEDVIDVISNLQR